jgi:insecticidal toxin complex protein TccC
MIDTRNNEIYLVPATRRSETVGVKGQIAWSASDLKYQWFHRTKHLGYKQADPMMKFHGALKMKNIDHGNAAYYLEGKQISRSEIQDEIDLFASWLELQYISMNWLGFFAYRDQTSGKMNLNFKSAQLNFPNLNIHEYNLGNIFILDGKNKIDFSMICNDSDLEQLKNKATNLPDKIKELVIKEMQKLN